MPDIRLSSAFGDEIDKAKIAILDSFIFKSLFSEVRTVPVTVNKMT